MHRLEIAIIPAYFALSTFWASTQIPNRTITQAEQRITAPEAFVGSMPREYALPSYAPSLRLRETHTSSYIR